MFFRSERLFLRPAWPEDWQALHAAIDDESVLRQLAMVPWPYTDEDAKAYAGLSHDPYLPQFLITRPHGVLGSQVLGSVGLHAEGGEVELGYWLGRQHWGHGYATEAVRAMLSIARAIGHRRLYAAHFLDNIASGKVLQRVGFRPQGELAPRMSVARGEFVPARRYALDLAEPDGKGSDEGPMRGALPRLVAA
jgi:RimJ/RimL family protein N-acetyltransferase